jgi:hypothetical protein
VPDAQNWHVRFDVSSGFRHGRLRNALVVAEVALSLVLLH